MSNYTYDTFEHVADLGIRGVGRTINDAFVGGAMAMMEVMLAIEKVQSKIKIPIACSSFDIPTLFVEWLNAILSKRDLESMAFNSFEVEVASSNETPALAGSAWGEPFDVTRHEPKIEVKAATYSQLKVFKEPSTERFIAQCIIDV